MTTTLFAIQHLPTGKYMPARMFKQSAHGWSWWEPSEDRAGYLPYDANPRLFYSKAAASNAIGQWLRGPLRKRVVEYGLVDATVPFAEMETGIEVQSAEEAKTPIRLRSHIEIVTLTLFGL